MKENIKTGIHFFLLGIFLSAVGFSTTLLDFTLIPRFCVLALSLTLTFYFLYRSKFEATIKMDAPMLLFTAYSTFVCVSTLWANTRSESYVESAKQLLFLLSFMLSLFALKKDPDHFYKTLSVISILVLIIALGFGVFQFLQLNQINKEALYSITGINGHKNLFSSFLFLNLFFLMLGLFRSKGILKIVIYICVFMSLLAITYLKTKAVWLGMIVFLASYILLLLFQMKVKYQVTKSKTLVFILIMAVVINVIFLLFFKDMLSKSIHYTSNLSQAENTQLNSIKLEEERLILWDKTLTIVKKHPLLGVGSGNWQVHFPDAGLSGLWRAEDLNYTFQRPHNDFLWILSETGIIGFNLFLFFLLFVLFNLFRLLWSIKNNREISLEVILCFSFILGFYTISFFDFPKERMEHSVWISIILGIACFHIRKQGDLKTIRAVKIKPYHSLILFILLTGILYIGVLRFKGEYYTRKMLDDKNNDRKLALIQTGSKALSFAYCIDPTSVPIHWYIGNAQAALGNYTAAKQDFLRAFIFAPFNRNVLNDLASSYAMNNEREQAKKYYKEAARISPRFDDPKLNLAAMYIQENNFKEAEFWLSSLYHDSERRTQYKEYILQNKK